MARTIPTDRAQFPAARVAAMVMTASVAAVISGLVSYGHETRAQAPGPCDPPNSNPVVCENLLPGNPDTEWDVSGAGSTAIQGFTTDISVDQGQTVSFKISTNATAYQLDIYRMGYYGGMGARKVATVLPSASLPQNQPACLSEASTGLIDCGNWAVSATWAVPTTAVSGIYFAKAIRSDTGAASHIMFVVRNDDGGSDLLFQTSDTTWQAYNQYGGNSLYTGNPAGRAYKVSYNRPLTVRGAVPEDSPFNAEYPMVRWLEANGYHVSYSTGVDTDRRGAEILEHKVFLSVGHDEYWSGTQRANVEAARAAGVHLAFFSGNEVFWKTRWENSISAGGTPFRTLVTYKETHANAKIDPAPNVWTGTWRDPRFSPPADGNRPENALTGTIFYVNSGTSGIQIPSAEGKMRFWRNTSVATLAPGAFATMPNGTLGYEWDEDRDNGFRPPGLIRMSDTTVSGVDYLQDFGSTYAPGTGNHALTLYKHASGALVFGAGTVQWSWGLDSNHDRGSAAPNVAMQQATINLFADMDANPLTPQGGLTTANPSTDTLAPSSAITFPAHGATVAANTTVVISGTAADAGGGVVGGVEVSVDGGLTWRRATGRSSWTYAWQSGGPRTVALFSRAVDDSGNLQTPTAGNSVTVGSGPVACPCSLWVSSQTPSGGPDSDPGSVELGTRFQSDLNGYITAVRFYKDAANTGTHTGSLWSSSGTLLSTVTFSGESASGWQEATLPSPVAVTAGAFYVVSYHTSSGFYSGQDGYFSAGGVDNGPLHAPEDGTQGPNGVYRYGASTVFPNETYNSENYWVDVVFVTSTGPDTTPPTVSLVTPSSGASGVAPTTTVSGTFNENVTNATAANFELRDSLNTLVAASVSYQSATRTATLTPNSVLAYSTAYTARLKGGAGRIADTAGNPLAADYTWSFTTAAPPPPPPNEGPGGPILVVGSTVNPFSRYYAEILRAEGLNAFTATDISQVSAATLAAYDVAILGDIPLTTAQVTMFTNWVTGGGNLVAMRPDKKLASLLGLTDAATTLTEGYLLVNTAAAPGAGIVNQTMQFHGTADRYALNGASTIATLFTNATTATTNPAVTIRSVGASGGQAAAFVFDLARSIVYTRQGNPAWSGQERDGIAPKRSDDLFFGGAQTDWVNLNKVAIPQADEQQRLLANLIGHMNSDRRPLPRFWYFPRGEKAAVVMTGDDHANNGTTGRFNVYKSNSPANCNVNNWECVRGTSYVFPNTPITNAQVSSFQAEGFEIGVHVRASGPNPSQMQCNDYTTASLSSDYTEQLDQFHAAYPAAGAVVTNRTHCIVWSDYDSQPQVALAHGIRLDTNYYYWPGSWVLDRPGFMTGSGMPMRFTKADGTLIDVYQAATQMTDESDQSWSFTIDTLLDRAIGPEGYYGFFTANMHTDTIAHVGSEAIVESALARSVPIISAKQLLTWIDGRNGSSFSNITWNGATLGFGVAAGSGSNGLEGMIPTNVGAAAVTGITRGGSPVSFRIETIKGVSYAIFSAATGTYQAQYGVDTTPPVISAVVATPSLASAAITWTTNEASTSRVDHGTAPTALDASATTPGLTSSHTVNLAGLSSGTIYYYRVRSVDQAGNESVSPVTAAAPASFTTTTGPNCPCTIWPASEVPAIITEQDSNAVELGVKFRSSVDGFITAIRFYKGPQNTGIHTGNLWTSTGTLLSTATFTGESASGWQQVTLPQPVAVTANTVYVASYHTPTGFYSDNGNYFGVSRLNAPLEALASPGNGGNGVYRYGAGGFPTDTYNNANYWVDVVFVQTATPNPSLSVADASVAEGNAGTANAVFNVSLSPASSVPVTVQFTTSNGTAIAGSDYTTTAGQLSFAAGVTTSTITVPVTGDTAAEPNETFLVALSNPAGAVIGDGQATGTIIDNDQPLPTITIADVTRAEGNSGTAAAVFTATLSVASGQTVAVAFATANGTAAAPTEYTSANGTLTFAAGVRTATFSVLVVGDTRDEPNETFFVNLSNPTNATIADGQAVGTITDNDNPPAIVVNNVTVAEGNGGTANAVFTVSVPAASDFPITVNYATANGTAVGGQDYTATSGTLPIAPGTTSAQLTVLVAGDLLDEVSETFRVNLSGATNASIGDSQGVGTITDNDPTPNLRINDVALTEPGSGTATAVFTVTLSAASGRTVTVNYATANVTAIQPGDYTSTSGTLTFAPGVTTQQISVPVRADALNEANETFNVNLSGAVAATIADTLGVGTIVN